MKSKKGVTWSAEVVAMLVLAVIIAIGVFLILKPVLDIGRSTGDKSAVKTWVLAKGNTKGIVGSPRPPVPYIDKPLIIDPSDLKSKGGNVYPQAFNDIANSMYNCWDAFGRGKINFLNSIDREVFCYPCRSVKFSSNAKEQFSSLPSGLLGFMNSEKIPSSFNSETYLQYLSNDPEYKLNENDITEPVISTSKDYYIMFFAVSGAYKIILGDKPFVSTVMVVDPEEFLNKCNDPHVVSLNTLDSDDFTLDHRTNLGIGTPAA